MKPHWPIYYDGFQRIVGKEHFETIRQRLNLDPEAPEAVFGLTDLQQLAVYLYTTPLDYYLRLNSSLRDWTPAPGPELPSEILIFAIGLENALRKLPIFHGTVFRGIQHPLSVAERVQQYQIGQAQTWNAFTSCSRDPDRAYAGNTAFRIQSKNGRSLAYFTADDDSEVVFSPFTTFQVLNVLIVSNDDMIVDLEEVES